MVGTGRTGTTRPDAVVRVGQEDLHSDTAEIKKDLTENLARFVEFIKPFYEAFLATAHPRYQSACFGCGRKL